MHVSTMQISMILDHDACIFDANKQVGMMQVHTTHDACIHDAYIHDACTHHACTHHACRKDAGIYDACISDACICDACKKWGRTDERTDGRTDRQLNSRSRI